MDNIRAVIDTLFSQINSLEILQGKKWQDITLGVTEEMFCSKFLVENRCYTLDQVRELYHLFITDWISSPRECFQSRETDFFYVLLHFCQKTLTEKDYQPMYRFQDLLRWRMITYKLGEDLFITSFLAFNDRNAMVERKSFNWPVVLMQDNPSVTHVLRKGVCDLHFHLRGSSLNYELNWLSLMNDMKRRRTEFSHLQKCLSHKVSTADKEKWESAYLTTFKAYAIRYYLFLLVNNVAEAETFKKETLEKILWCEDEFSLSSAATYINLQIDKYRFIHGYKLRIRERSFCPDYAIVGNWENVKCENLAGMILSGERYLMYKMFRGIFSHEIHPEDKWLFYIYLLQKAQIRKELVQVNEKAGFSNFSDYERRKEIFIERSWGYQELIPKLAVSMAFSKGYLNYLECRITPKDTSRQLIRAVYTLERQIGQRMCKKSDAEKTRKHYYILHFIKQRDSRSDKLIRLPYKEKWEIIPCRHHEFRKKIKMQGKATLEALEKNTDLAEWIVGMDAANSELYCRPEVFGPIYRYMKQFCNSATDLSELGSEYYRGQRSLNFTYHVGEDFWDITDGLRAIDEAILFLNLKAGDRMGHALVLGLDVEAYYKHRNCRVVMSKQNILDNVMWLHRKACTLGIQLSANVSLELRNTFTRFYDEVYLDKRKKKFSHDEMDNRLVHGRDIDIYYRAWLLRGDDPVFYHNPLRQLEEYEYDTKWNVTALNTMIPDMNTSRLHETVVWLYHYYHYNAGIRQRGEERSEVLLTPDIIELIKKVQHAMRREIASKYIGIEANITSNHLIGDMKRYVQHPIVQLYSLGLPLSDKKGCCPQLSVSINTDDRGIFDTSIEDEYALLALALEKEQDANGNKRYMPRDVYEWLNNIRKLGFEQQFRKHGRVKHE